MEGLTDDFKWFGEAFEGFPKRLPEDCVEYTLFIIDSKLKQRKEVLARLEGVRKEALKLTDRLLKNYIWQREHFKLEIESKKGMIYLHGVTSYGDSVEDEWLIVYILKELSSRFPELWIKVVDTDGEFLLIEAANALPRWLNPEIADNRVWIHKNVLRIIPLKAIFSSVSTKHTEPVSRSISLEESLKIISSTPNILIQSPLIEAEAFYRIRNYPAQIANTLHHALVTIPKKIAYILHLLPMSIAPAVEAFYLRDPIALKPLETSSSELVFPPEDLVTVSTRFAKVLYAQVKSQQFSPPIVWRDILSRAEMGLACGNTTSESYTHIETGMKVTSGFEMLVTDPKNNDSRMVREIKILLDDLVADADADLPSNEEIAKWQDVNREDDEKWLDINFEDFEKELQGKNREKKSGEVPGVFEPEVTSGFGDANTQADLKKMVERFEAFLNDDDAGVEGAEMDEMDIDDDDDDEDDGDDDSEDEDKDVSFDENEFARMMREMMGMPSEEVEETDQGLPGTARSDLGEGNKILEIDNGEEDSDRNEACQIRKAMQRMEAELNEAGALNLDPTPRKLAALKDKRQMAKGKDHVAEQDWQDESDEEVNIDLNLAKNLLESFKSQAGMAGPGGNLMGLMGMQLPRDEDDTESVKKNT